MSSTKYQDGYCQQAIELGRDGASEAQIAAHFMVAKSTLRKWRSVHDEFDEAMEVALTLSQSWWEDSARTGHAQSTIGPSIWKHTVNNRFREDYTDRVAVGGDGDAPPIQVQMSAQDVLLNRINNLVAARAEGEADSGSDG